MKIISLGNIKITYLILLSVALFFLQSWVALTALFIFQCLLWYFSKLKLKPLFKALYKMKWFFIIILISYTLFIPTLSSEKQLINFGLFSIHYSPNGLIQSFVMLTRIVLMLMASLWVRLSSTQKQFISAIRFHGAPKAVAIIIDLTLQQLSSNKKKLKKNKKKISFTELKENKNKFIADLIYKSTNTSDKLLQMNYPNMGKEQRKDIVILLSIVIAIMSLKFLQMMPGLPIAPGHKNLLIIPLLILASLSTHMKYGGLVAGFTTGIVSFMMGFGKFGIFEILHFAFPGLIADWLSPMLQQKQGKFLMIKLVLIGAILGLARFIANFAILLLVGAPKLALIVMTPMLISQIIFGALSSLICIIVVIKHNNDGWF